MSSRSDEAFYVLKCETAHYHDDTGVSQEVIGVFPSMELALEAMQRYLPDEYGEDFEDEVFESVETLRDGDAEECCGGVMIEAVDMEGDVTRLWVEEMRKGPAGA